MRVHGLKAIYMSAKYTVEGKGRKCEDTSAERPSTGLLMIEVIVATVIRALVPVHMLAQVHSETGVANSQNIFEILVSQTKAALLEEILSHKETVGVHVDDRTIASMAPIGSHGQDETVATHTTLEDPPKL